MATGLWSPISIFGSDGTAPVVLICEHASANFPADFGAPGTNDEVQRSHAAWDIGALDVAVGLSKNLGAPLIAGAVSRLLYDCNRPFDSADSTPVKSESFEIPGNENLSDHDRSLRYRLIHQPFHFAVRELIALQSSRAGRSVTVISIHSFTPVYLGNRRDTEIGFLHHGNAEFSQIAKQVESARGIYRTDLNKPYSAADGVTYSLDMHADKNGLHSTMIEIRNDLIDTESKARAMAEHLSTTFSHALAHLAEKKG